MIRVLRTGEKPGKGWYRCKYCSYVAVLESDQEELPVCPQCGAREWYEIREA